MYKLKSSILEDLNAVNLSGAAKTLSLSSIESHMDLVQAVIMKTTTMAPSLDSRQICSAVTGH